MDACVNVMGAYAEQHQIQWKSDSLTVLAGSTAWLLLRHNLTNAQYHKYADSAFYWELYFGFFMCPNKSTVDYKVDVSWMKIISWYVNSSAMFKMTVVWKKQLWSVSVLLLLSEVEVMHLSAVCRPQLRYKNRRRKPRWLPDVDKMCCDVNRRKMLSQKLLQSNKSPVWNTRNENEDQCKLSCT